MGYLLDVIVKYRCEARHSRPKDYKLYVAQIVVVGSTDFIS